ncbi:MAG: general secretion pathway protein GspK [Kiritimatiellia bacterium]
MPRLPQARSGMALILTLAAIVLAGGLALFLQARAAALSRAEQAEVLQEKLRVAAAEAAREALLVLASDPDLQVDHLAEAWAAPMERNREDGLSTWAVVEDAGRFFNWNNLSASNRSARAPREILVDLMMYCGDYDAESRVDALVDYLDADESGAYEAGAYQAAEVPFRPPNRPLWSPAELLNVRGFSPERFQPRPRTSSDEFAVGDLASCTALVPAALEKPIPINLNTVDREVLMGVTGGRPGLRQEAAVRAVLTLRQMQPTNTLSMVAMAYPELGVALGDSVGEASSYFRVKARASMGGAQREAMAWVKRDRNGDVQILQWVEGEG